MPHKDKEEAKLYRKQYREKNKEAIALKQSNFYQKNKEQLGKKMKEYNKENNKLPKTIKQFKVSNWKTNGIIDEDLSAVYDYLIKQTHCMICLKEYKNSRERCLDHDHLTGEIRYICCRGCNTNLLRE